MIDITKIRPIIEGMGNDSFREFHTELQYGLKWHERGHQVAASSIFFQTDFHDTPESGKRYDGYSYHGRLIDDIRVCYQIVRDEIKRRFGKEFNKEWVGWPGLGSTQDIEKIEEAVSVIFGNPYPTDGLLGIKQKSSQEELTEARDTLKGYGIQGFFADKEKGLGEIILEHYQR